MILVRVISQVVWSPLGLQLSLLQPTLIHIKAKYINNPDEYLQECLT